MVYAGVTQLLSRDWAGQQAQLTPLRTMTTDRLQAGKNGECCTTH